jgi:hypothetical protein
MHCTHYLCSIAKYNSQFINCEFANTKVDDASHSYPLETAMYCVETVHNSHVILAFYSSGDCHEVKNWAFVL